MYDYPPLDRLNVERPIEHFLFLAVMPDASAAARVADLGEDLRSRYRLSGDLQSSDRFHITLFGIYQGYTLPPKIVVDVARAAASVARPPFDVTLDRVKSFRRSSTKPLVLCGSQDGVAALHRFRQALGLALIGAGFRHCAKESFTPHMTLLYDPRDIGEHEVEPIRWTARDFVLIESLRGLTRHIHLGRWPLRGEPNG